MVSTASKIRVLLVMGEAAERAELSELLGTWPEMSLVALESMSSDALAVASREKPHTAIFDAGPNLDDSGWDFLSALIRAMDTGGVILIAGESDSTSRIKAIHMGVNGIVHKARIADELRKAVIKVTSGELWLDRLSGAQFIFQITRPSLAGKSDPIDLRISSLTERERQIAYLVCQGLQNEEIGKRLSISDTTVRHHLTSIFAKIGVSNRLELTVFLYRRKFARPLVENDFALSRSIV